MKGIGFWESPQEVYDKFNAGETLNTNCFSMFLLTEKGCTLDNHQFSRILNMGIPQLLADRATSKHESNIHRKDLTQVNWENIDQDNAKGSFEFDAFYGSGRVVFRAKKKDSEWVVYYMAVPRKNSSDDDNPYVAFDLSDEEIEEFCQPVE